MASREDIKRYRENWQGEIDASATYRAMAEAEANAPLAEVYRKLAKTEEAHAVFWEEKLREAGQPVGSRKPTFRARAIIWLARRFGPRMVLPTLSATEQTASHGYDKQPEVAQAAMPAEEQSHARVLRALSNAGGQGKGMEGGALARLEGRHRAVGGNAIRAAVLGANDGLCSTLSLVMGVAGAGQSSHTILIAGIAGMLAGSCAMAMGEWLSVQSARELAQKQLTIEADELKAAPEEEAEELSLIYQAKGLPREEADSLASRLISNKDMALDTLAREELGLDPEELGGSSWEAAITSFFLFIAGAIAPVTPFIFLGGRAAIFASLGCSAVALFLIGAVITLLTGRGLLFSGVRQLVIGFAAAAVTFGIGRLVGMAVG
jgi:VIT1/CCC1 family predicted Fe2+/Mn2+ transporter